jgi:ABC-type sulfate/molybdate transport systems ATPase subunit
MLEFAIKASRGNFHLQVECSFASPWTVFFGHSGAGKSTLLRLLAGLDSASDAWISFDGEVLSDVRSGIWRKPGSRHTALVTQSAALFPHLSVAANLAYGLRNLDRKAQAGRVEEALELVGGLGLRDRQPRDLSGGEAQRVALARALAVHPRLLLLDEPFSALDGNASDALLARLQPWLKQTRVQTVLATHDAADAIATSSDVALLKEGRLIGFGPAADVLAQERERLKARLAGL